MTQKVGRNDACPCGSGRKYKKCHGNSDNEARERARFGTFGSNPIRESLTQAIAQDPFELIKRIDGEKAAGSRRWPSETLVTSGEEPPLADRAFLIDACARLVDDNWCGRSELCVYFAVLVRHGLSLMGYDAVVEVGKGTYSGAGKTFEWDHAWVRTTNDEVIDGNVDSMPENPFVPVGIAPRPFWGPGEQLPTDRKLQVVRVLSPHLDTVELDAARITSLKLALERQIAKRPNSAAGA